MRIIRLHVLESGRTRAVGRDLEDHEARADHEGLELHTSELVVLGSHGHSGLGDLIHGTPVERLRHRVSVPVLVVPSGT